MLSLQNPPASYILFESLKDAPLTKVMKNAIVRGATVLLRGSVVTASEARADRRAL